MITLFILILAIGTFESTKLFDRTPIIFLLPMKMIMCLWVILIYGKGKRIIRVTNTQSTPTPVHIQIFARLVPTVMKMSLSIITLVMLHHVDNLRDIQTNDGNPSGVVIGLDGAYGIFVAYIVDEVGIGNLRIQDANGYEYRTNLNGVGEGQRQSNTNAFTFNFNTQGGVVFSDIVRIGLSDIQNEAEVFAADILNNWITLESGSI